jgi:hypothetical protein
MPLAKGNITKNTIFINWLILAPILKKKHSSAGISTGYGLAAAGVRFLAEARSFSLFQSVQTGSGSTRPFIQWVLAALSPRLNWPGHEAEY